MTMSLMSLTLADSYIPRLVSGPPFENGEEMKYEAVRLGTFALWSSYEVASPLRLAKAGFFYTGVGDVVKCFVCHASKGGWNKHMIPEIVHRELSPSCRFYQGAEGVNSPIYVPDQLQYQQIQDALHRKYCGGSGAASASGSAGCFVLVRDNPDYSSASYSQDDTFKQPPAHVPNPTSFPVVATDAGLPATSRQAIGVGQGHGHDSEATPTREEFAPMKQEVNRFNSFTSRWPRGQTPDPRDLARSGFYYTGTADRVQCAFCRGILRNWDEDDVPSEEHRRHFPMCPFVMGGSCGNVPDTQAMLSANKTDEFMQVTQPAAVVSDASLGIVTERPKHPNYAVEASRVNSFRNWPSGKEQTPQLLAKAGFYFAGFGDSVKCFFCDGGLRTWEQGDDPWTEHARWFPRCPYVLQVKGDDFIQKALEGRENGAAITGRTVASNATTTNTDTSTILRPVDPRALSARMDSTMVQTVLSMGFTRNQVSRAILKRLQETGDDFPSIEALMDSVFQIPEDEPPSSTEPVSTPAGSSNSEVHNAPAEIGVKGDSEERSMERDSSDDDDSQSLIEENRQLKEQRQCKICMDEEVNVVFLPCGHLVCCATCAPALHKCPICRANIRGTVRTFLS